MTPTFPPGPLPAAPVLWWGRTRLWLWRTAFAQLFSARAKKFNRRPTHPLGVGASGQATVVAQPGFPPHPFFQPGRKFALKLRHANLAREDDACLDIRSATISLVDRDERLDLPMNTGMVSAFWDTTSFVQFVRANLKGKAGLQVLLAQSPRHKLGATSAMVRAPASYTSLAYYAQLTFRWQGNDEIERLVRYRIVPKEGEGTLVLDNTDRENLWDHERRDSEKRPADYLRAEFAARVQKTPARYRLQAQFQESRPAGDVAFDSAVAWDVPWVPVADLQLDSVLPPAETEALRFNIGNSPRSLGFFAPTHPDDGNALAYYRASIYATTQAVRGKG